MPLRPFYVKFRPSSSLDVVGYKLYWEPAGTPISDVSPQVSVGNPPVGMDGKIAVDISQFPQMAAMDGDYVIGVSAVDDFGNESGILQGSTTVDFVAPAAPTDLEFLPG